jgi:hypothetical protein
MFEAFAIKPVVETQDQNGDVTCEAFVTLAAAQKHCDEYEAGGSFSGREGKRIIWTLYGVNPIEFGVRTQDAIYDCDTEDSAREQLESIVGAVSKAADGTYYPQLIQTTDGETLYDLTTNLAADLALGNIPEEKIEDSRNRHTLLVSWANEFNNLHRGREWDGDYLDAVDDFYAEKTAHLRTTKAPPQLVPAVAAPVLNESAATPFKVRMLWGSGAGGDEKPSRDYEFTTQSELDAFLEGCSEANGWLDMEQIDPNPDGTFPDQADERSECQNCRLTWKDDELKEIKHLSERVAPGEPMPSGECPDCGALCHPLPTP